MAIPGDYVILCLTRIVFSLLFEFLQASKQSKNKITLVKFHQVDTVWKTMTLTESFAKIIFMTIWFNHKFLAVAPKQAKRCFVQKNTQLGTPRHEHNWVCVKVVWHARSLDMAHWPLALSNAEENILSAMVQLLQGINHHCDRWFIWLMDRQRWWQQGVEFSIKISIAVKSKYYMHPSLIPLSHHSTKVVTPN